MQDARKAIELLEAFQDAHARADLIAMEKVAGQTRSFLEGRKPDPDEIASFAVADWRVEDGDADGLEERHLGKGLITVSRASYGLLFDMTPPGASGPHGIAVEFDRGSAKANVFRHGADDVQAVLRIDERGAHVSDDRATAETGMLLRGEEAPAAPTTGAWEPAPAAPGAPHP